MLTKSQLKDIFTQYGFRPLKRFGENYLIDANIKDKIITEAHISPEDTVLEIGPGLGALTMDLAASGAKVYAIEKDRKAFAILSDLAKGYFPNLKLFCGDILKFDLKGIFSSGKIKVVSNLPYYITTPIVEYIIENRGRLKSALILVQREVANRLLASPGTKDYASISCYVQYYTKPSYIHTVKRTSFYPEPDVDSSLIKLDIPDKPSVEVKDEKLFFKIIRGAFNQRRKAIINSLSREEVLNIPKDKLLNALNAVGINSEHRPERLSLAQFADIAKFIQPWC